MAKKVRTLIWQVGFIFVIGCSFGSVIENENHNEEIFGNNITQTSKTKKITKKIHRDFECSFGVQTRGYTWPVGDIALEHGDTLDLYCVIYDDEAKLIGENASSKLVMMKDGHRLASELLEVINSTTVKLHVNNHPLGRTFYECDLFSSEKAHSLICSNIVVVGHKPEPVTDLKCISYNYENLTCTFTPPENYVKTDYELGFSLRARSAHPVISCPNLVYDEEQNKMVCVWTIYSTPQYRQAHREYYFQLQANNTFGVFNYNDTFMHYTHVLSGPPVGLKAEWKTTDMISLSWSPSPEMQMFPPGLHHRVLYQCQYAPKVWRLAAIITDQMKETVVRYNLTGIEHPHILCDIRVSMRSAEAHYDDESMWSLNSTITERTMSAIPSMPPETNVGSFELISNNVGDLKFQEAYIYWKQIEDEDRNGPDFKYKVEVNGNTSIKPVEITNTYARFVDLEMSQDYVFNIWSTNANGTSKDKSVVRVPNAFARVKGPGNFVKVEYVNRMYELSWNKPNVDKKIERLNEEDERLTNYTLFWCKNDRDRPDQCTGKLNWVVIPPQLTSYNHTLHKKGNYQFAISANTQYSSSGMWWSSCNFIHQQKNVERLKNVWINSVGATSIELGWKLDCNRIGSVAGYLIHYCPIKTPTSPSCIGSELYNVTITGDVDTHKGVVRGLKPYSTYMLTISAITRHAVSPQSDPLFNTTLESAPSRPEDVQLTDVTNSSITIKWNAPKASNGVLKYYKVHLIGSFHLTREVNPNLSETLQEYTCQDLESYRKYQIYVEACTVACTNSTSISVQTKMGYPGVITQPTISLLNKSVTIVKWGRPSPPRGKTDFYEVRLTQVHKGVNTTLPIFNVTEPMYSVESCGEDVKDNFFISVRAVNIIDNKQFEGPWSNSLEAYCQTGSDYIIYVIVFSSCLFAVLMFYLGKRLYLKCKIMSNVEVKLPSGLDTITASNHTLAQWGNGEKMPIKREHSQSDQEMLLAKISENQHHHSGESSGCSSAADADSATSSLRSGSHISTSSSDSGTEQPRSPDSPAEEESRRYSLRLRNVVAARGTEAQFPPSKGYVVMPPMSMSDIEAVCGPRPRPVPPSSYCIVGVDNAASAKLDSCSPYVTASPPHRPLPSPCSSITDVESPSTNPGYVPFTAEPISSSATHYVVAGNKNLLVPDFLSCEPLKMLLKDDTSKSEGSAILKPNFQWQVPDCDNTSQKAGYVTVGDTKPPYKSPGEVSKSSYVPHCKFEVKSLKED